MNRASRLLSGYLWSIDATRANARGRSAAPGARGPAPVQGDHAHHPGGGHEDAHPHREVDVGLERSGTGPRRARTRPPGRPAGPSARSAGTSGSPTPSSRPGTCSMQVLEEEHVVDREARQPAGRDPRRDRRGPDRRPAPPGRSGSSPPRPGRRPTGARARPPPPRDRQARRPPRRQPIPRAFEARTRISEAHGHVGRILLQLARVVEQRRRAPPPGPRRRPPPTGPTFARRADRSGSARRSTPGTGRAGGRTRRAQGQDGRLLDQEEADRRRLVVVERLEEPGERPTADVQGQRRLVEPERPAHRHHPQPEGRPPAPHRDQGDRRPDRDLEAGGGTSLTRSPGTTRSSSSMIGVIGVIILGASIGRPRRRPTLCSSHAPRGNAVLAASAAVFVSSIRATRSVEGRHSHAEPGNEVGAPERTRLSITPTHREDALGAQGWLRIPLSRFPSPGIFSHHRPDQLRGDEEPEGLPPCRTGRPA